MFARGKLSFDENVALHRVPPPPLKWVQGKVQEKTVWQTRRLAGVREMHLTQYIT